jgi:hypothetical protein
MWLESQIDVVPTFKEAQQPRARGISGHAPRRDKGVNSGPQGGISWKPTTRPLLWQMQVSTLSSATAADFDFVVSKTKSKRAAVKLKSPNALSRTLVRLDNVFS